MLTDEQIDILSDALVPLYQYLESAVIADIARRINKTMTYTRTAELQVITLRELGYSPAKIRAEVMRMLRADKEFQRQAEQNTLEYKQEVRNIISGITAQARAAGNDIVASAGEMSWIDDMRAWEAAGKELGENSRLRQIVKDIQRQTSGELRNLTRTTGFRTASGWESVQNLYRMELDKALVKMSSGAFSSDQCVVDMVRDLSRSGLRVIDYASGRTYQLDTAARMCLRTAGNQMAAQVMDMNLESTGSALVQVSAHWGARNKGEGIANHKQWQGLIYSTDGKPHPEEEERISQKITDLKEATGYDVHTGQGTVDGLHGVNCRHQHFVFFEGISRPVEYPPEPEPREINGKKYDYYAMTQRQRELERGIRAMKREKEALKVLGKDTGDIQARIRQKTAGYKQFSAQCGIRPKTNRLRVESGTSDLTKTQAWKAYQAEKELIAKQPVRDITGKTEEKVIEVHNVGRIDREIYKCITDDIITDEVIITDERIQHVKDRHPNDYERFCRCLKEIVESPQFIVETNKPNSALILKGFMDGTEQFKTVLRLNTPKDNPNYKNSIITFMKINEKEWNRLLRNKKILYKKE